MPVQNSRTQSPDYTDYLNSLRHSITVLRQQEYSIGGPKLVEFAHHLEAIIATFDDGVLT